ncbi:MAG: hypothetical protein Q8R00_03165 [Candidatus Nanoarchaeia archaeon]|nr:hypothetical protein [Candidatus Nanoarchaeia archaeon]
MKIPDNIFGKDREAELKKYLEESKVPKVETQPESKIIPAIIPASNISNKKEYIILEGKTYGSYSYPDLLVSANVVHHNNNWHKTQEILHNEGNFMLTIRQYVDFLNLITTGKPFDASGNRVDRAKLAKIVDEILTVRSPYRAEWLDAKFRKQSKGLLRRSELVVDYGHMFVNGQSQPKYSEPLEECLMEDRTPGINLDDWLERATIQGLPPRDIKQGDLYYWYPRDGSVAGFVAGSGRAFLDCYWDPRSSGPELGVRQARAKI